MRGRGLSRGKEQKKKESEIKRRELEGGRQCLENGDIVNKVQN